MRALSVFFALGVAAVACVRPIPQGRSNLDELGCPIPPPSTFQKVGFSVDVAQATIRGNSVTGLKASVNPEVFSLVSKAVLDEQALAYLNCLARGSYPPHLSQWYSTLDLFMRTRPSAAEFLQWQAKNPIPEAPPKEEYTVLIQPDGYIFGTTSLGEVRASRSTAAYRVDGAEVFQMRLDERGEDLALKLSSGTHTFEFVVDIKGSRASIATNCMVQFQVSGPSVLAPRIDFKVLRDTPRVVEVDKCTLRPRKVR